MRLLKSKTAAEEELRQLIADGYRVLDILQQRGEARPDGSLIGSEVELWKTRVANALRFIFPDQLWAPVCFPCHASPGYAFPPVELQRSR
jgi:hypothetical protein